MEILDRTFEQIKIELGNESFNQVISYRYSKLDYFMLVSLVETETNKKFECHVLYNDKTAYDCYYYLSLYEVTEFNYELCERPVNDDPNFFKSILTDSCTKISISITDINGKTTFKF